MGGEGFARAARGGRAEYRKLDGGFLAGALRAGDFLLLVDHDFLEFVLAVVADVFVDRHGGLKVIIELSRRNGDGTS